jgi:predicted nicotinamide N-methyase
MALSNAEKQARWRERHLDSTDGTKMRAQFVFDAGTSAQLKRIAAHKDCSVTALIREWAASAERRITRQLSGKALKAYYDGK